MWTIFIIPFSPNFFSHLIRYDSPPHPSQYGRTPPTPRVMACWRWEGCFLIVSVCKKTGRLFGCALKEQVGCRVLIQPTVMAPHDDESGERENSTAQAKSVRVCVGG